MPESLRQAQNRANDPIGTANVCVFLARFLHKSLADIYGSRLQSNACNFKCLRPAVGALRPLLKTGESFTAFLVDTAPDLLGEGSFGHMCLLRVVAREFQIILQIRLLR